MSLSLFVRPGVLLRIEDLGLLATAVLLYAHLHLSWLLFAVLFLAPDLSMVGYAMSARMGTALYNLGHFLLLPLALLVAGFGTGRRWMVAVGIIWFSHIVFDRLLGFGLKYPTQFKDTHLQRLDVAVGDGI